LFGQITFFSGGKPKFGADVYAPSSVIGQQWGLLNKVFVVIQPETTRLYAHYLIEKYCTKKALDVQLRD
jgi:hypothetical protein